jgi:hypothetical protein
MSVFYAFSASVIGVGTPLFKPAALMNNPRDFGRSHKPRWNPLDPDVQADPARAREFRQLRSQLGWARQQHAVAFAVQEVLKEQGLTLESFAQILDANVAWLERKLHGQAPASLAAMFEWTQVLEIDLTINLKGPGQFGRDNLNVNLLVLPPAELGTVRTSLDE